MAGKRLEVGDIVQASKTFSEFIEGEWYVVIRDRGDSCDFCHLWDYKPDGRPVVKVSPRYAREGDGAVIDSMFEQALNMGDEGG